MSTPNCVHPEAADSVSGEAETREAVLVEVDSEEEDREVSVIDAQGGERAEVAGMAEEYEEGVVVDALAHVDGEQRVDMPDMAGGKEERKQLIDEQNRDETLKDHRQWAEKGEKGYTFDNGLLVHELTTPLEQVCTRIVVPRGRRAELLKLAHGSILGGHFSHSKTTELLNRKFTWPRMSIDVKKLCSQCVPCQKASQRGPPCNHYQC